jgi:hypothetical protein
MQVIMDADFPVRVECVEQARAHIGPVERYDRLPRQASVDAEQFVVRRGLSSVNITLDENSPDTVSVGFAWLGRAPVEEEQGSLRLLEDVQAAIMQACNLSEPRTRITKTCAGARACKEWLAAGTARIVG